MHPIWYRKTIGTFKCAVWVVAILLGVAMSQSFAVDTRILEWEELVPGGYQEPAMVEPPAGEADLTDISADQLPPESADEPTTAEDEGWVMDETATTDLNNENSNIDPASDDMVDESGPPLFEQEKDFRVVEKLNGQSIRIPGFIVPFDVTTGGDLKEFLLVPYFGACIHVPPPPPNQMVYVTSDRPVKVDDIWNPFWIEGVLEIKRYDSDLGSTAYTMTAYKVSPYE